MSPQGKQHAIVVGFDYHAQYFARLINAHSERWSLRFYGRTRFDTLRALVAMRRADALICFGGPGPDAALAEAARRSNVPVIVIWAGTDVVLACEDPGLLEVIKQYGFINVAVAEWLVEELRELGIDARYACVASAGVPADPAPLPMQFRVISYLPEPKRSFYGEKEVYAVARAFPDVPFTIAGKGAPNPGAPRNVEFVGHVDDMPQWLDKSTVLLRLPEHDGKSMLVIEALARGRHVIWNYEFPGVHSSRNVADAIGKVRELYLAHQAGTLQRNVHGCEYVREHFSPADVASNFEMLLGEASAHRKPRRVARHRVAISGYNLFAAQVAEAVDQSELEWEPRVLRVNGNLERLTSLVHLASADVWYLIGTPVGDHWLDLFAKLLGVPRVIHWVGSDLQALAEQPRLARNCRGTAVNLAEVDWTIAELRRLGLDATLAPLPPRIEAPEDPPALPERFTVLVYVPRSRGDFYGRREYERLIRAFAGRPIRFIVVGGGECFAPDGADVISLGWCADLRGVYAQSTVLLRLTKHDGLSLMTLEALSYGRYVLWSRDFPFVTQVQSYADCERELSELLERHLAGALDPRSGASRYVRERYDAQRCIADIARSWDEAASRRRTVPFDAARVRP
jgi:glycosyltransferase involved in cell wall biosynthesis